MTRPAPRVLIHNRPATAPIAAVRARHPDAVVEGCESYEGLAAAVADFRPDVVFTVRFEAGRPYPTAALIGPGGPPWIAVGGSGVDHLGQWDPAAQTVTNAAGVAAGMMAEYILGAALHFRLDVPGLIADRAARRWRADRMMRPLAGDTALVVGLGATGLAVAARATAFGMRVIGVRARPEPMSGLAAVHPPSALPGLWPEADLIAICTPLTAQTRGLVGADAIAAMKPDAVLVDVSRGGVVDGAALAAALAAGHLAGVALDVFETEPLPPDDPLWTVPRTLISPHCSSVFDGWEAASLARFCDNLDRWRAGEPLTNVVDPARGY